MTVVLGLSVRSLGLGALGLRQAKLGVGGPFTWAISTALSAILVTSTLNLQVSLKTPSSPALARSSYVMQEPKSVIGPWGTLNLTYIRIVEQLTAVVRAST